MTFVLLAVLVFLADVLRKAPTKAATPAAWVCLPAANPDFAAANGGIIYPV